MENKLLQSLVGEVFYDEEHKVTLRIDSVRLTGCGEIVLMDVTEV